MQCSWVQPGVFERSSVPSQQEVLLHALTFSKDAFLTAPNSSARTDHRRSAERLLPSPSAAESNQAVSARINAPWHRAANAETHQVAGAFVDFFSMHV